MIRRNIDRFLACVTVDLNTQKDFCDATGSAPVANVATLIPALRRVIAWIKRNDVPMVSSVDSHRPSEIAMRGGPHFCVDGTIGQRKVEFTVFPRCTRLEVDNTFSVPLDLFDSYQQIIFRKRTDDLLSNPKADRFLTQLPAGEFLLFGNALESAVKALALGLLAREKRVSVVHDACGYWSLSSADLALRQMCAKGARVITVDELLARKLPRDHRYSVRRLGVAVINGERRITVRWPAGRWNGRSNGRLSASGRTARIPRSNGQTRPFRAGP